jgi:MFS family permease
VSNGQSASPPPPASAAASRPAGGFLRYREVLKHRNFALLWAGQTVSWFGDSLYFVSLLWLVQEITGSRAIMGLVAACRTVPLLFGVFAGVAVDRVDRRKMMIATDLLRAAFVFAVPLLVAGEQPAWWPIPVVAFLLSSAGVFFQPSQQSLLPAIVKREQLAQANSLLTVSQQFANVVGYTTAGVMIAAIGVRPMFVIDGVTFLVSVAAVYAMRLAAHEANPSLARAQQQAAQPSASTAAWQRWRGDLGEGLRFIRGNRAMLAVIPLMMALNFLLAPFIVLMPAWVKDVLGAGPGTFGLLETAITVGMIFGSVVLGFAAARVRRSILVLAAVGLFGAGALVFAASRLVPLTAVVMAVMGCANAAVNIIVVTWTQTVVPRAMMGRVFGTLGTLFNAVSPVGQSIAGLVGHTVALPVLFGGVGAIYIGIAVVYALVPVLRGAFDLGGLTEGGAAAATTPAATTQAAPAARG